MKFAKRFLSLALAGAALMAATQARAVTTWNFSYSGVGVTAAGTFTTAGAAVAPEDLLSISGVRNGAVILGLVPLDSDDNFSYDNQFMAAAPHFTSDGLLFDVGGGQLGHVNLYFFEGDYTDLVVDDDGNPTETPVTFAVSLAPVPEAASLVYMALGLGGVGLVLRRRQRATRALPLAA